MKAKDRARRFEALGRMQCQACAQNQAHGLAQVPLAFPLRIERHHQNEDGKAGNRRLGDEFTVPLDGWHHRGVTLRGYTRKMMTQAFGPSLATESRRFRTVYGTDAEMLARTNELLDKHDPDFLENAA